MSETKMDGAALIAAERKRQVEVEGWTPEHDDEHDVGELASAAATYILETTFNAPTVEGTWCSELWPFDNSWFKLSPDPIRNLVKAGALIAAEIDRLQRAAPKP